MFHWYYNAIAIIAFIAQQQTVKKAYFTEMKKNLKVLTCFLSMHKVAILKVFMPGALMYLTTLKYSFHIALPLNKGHSIWKKKKKKGKWKWS